MVVDKKNALFNLLSFTLKKKKRYDIISSSMVVVFVSLKYYWTNYTSMWSPLGIAQAQAFNRLIHASCIIHLIKKLET